MPIRQPIISILGHVDHGKTTLLDTIRASRVAIGEAGGITQHIGASEVPVENILKTCNSFLKKWKIDVKIPGLLFIDTPGHAAFSLLRKRGGALADIAILVIDITEGIKPQTDEAIKILRDNKTPFIIAANKVDKISGWQTQKDACFHDAFDAQSTKIQEELDLKIYTLIGQLGERNIMSDRFDRITDFTKTIAIVPVSGRSGEGVADLLGLITGLSQKYLEKKLALDESGVGKGTVLEVKEVKGLGMTLDIILYDGIMRQGDTLVIGAREKPVVTKVKAILKIPPLKEIRVEKKFVPVKEVLAAVGIKVSAMNIDEVIAGVPIYTLREGALTKEYEDLVRKEIESVEIVTSNEGLIIKADALGSLEAIVRSIKEKNIPIRKALIGAVSRKDILEVKDSDPKYKVVLAFNANVADDAKQESKDTGVKILESEIIYRLLEGYDEYLKDLDAAQKKALSESLKKPAKVRIIPGFVFRQSKPAVVGMEIVLGTLKKDAKLMNSVGEVLGDVEQVQDKNVNIDEGKIGMKCAVSVDGFVVGRNAKENEVFYTFLTKEEYKLLRKNIGFLSQSEITCLDEIKQVMLKTDKLWDL
ncbi:MAG: translation initiation factor IF-2 [Nanoarchaeota archaeon]|nr:translation initiation factor IF-2 [Nanoarchaeota archaeon]MBU4300586.1 translation initiation factor IF-2 [Nanoarchaeota archaeon]MBU4451732.1 translation initiation factor IF-2 [Nanoarchaeota archaeon]MCG2723701.1 translation initiation factor IF-2 [archaeon]